MALERTYVIPLRTGWLKSPKYKRAKRAVSVIKNFLVRHMKSEDVRLGTKLNEELWKHGIKNPPSKVKVNVVRDDKGVVRAELPGFKFEEKVVEVEKKGVVKKLTEKIAGKEKPVITTSIEPKPVQKKPEVKTEEPKATPKVEEKPAVEAKPEVKETPKEEPKAEVKEAPKVEKAPEAKPVEKKEVKAAPTEAPKEEPKVEKPAE